MAKLFKPLASPAIVAALVVILTATCIGHTLATILDSNNGNNEQSIQSKGLVPFLSNVFGLSPASTMLSMSSDNHHEHDHNNKLLMQQIKTIVDTIKAPCDVTLSSMSVVDIEQYASVVEHVRQVQSALTSAVDVLALTSSAASATGGVIDMNQLLSFHDAMSEAVHAYGSMTSALQSQLTSAAATTTGASVVLEALAAQLAPVMGQLERWLMSSSHYDMSASGDQWLFLRSLVDTISYVFNTSFTSFKLPTDQLAPSTQDEHQSAEQAQIELQVHEH